MRSLKDFLVKVEGLAREERVLDDKTVFFAFEKVVQEWYGTKGKENIFPEEWAPDGTLSVRVRSSLWLNEFLLEKERLLEKINSFLGSPAVKRIVLKRG